MSSLAEELGLNFDVEKVTSLLKNVSSINEITSTLDEYFEVSDYLSKLQPEDLRKNYYQSFNQLLYELLEDVCKFYHNRVNPKDTRNIDFFAGFMKDLAEEANEEEISVKVIAAWLKCFGKQLKPHAQLLKSRNPALFSSKLHIKWFKRKNFTPGKAKDAHHCIEDYLEETQKNKPEFLDELWAKLNNLYLIYEVDELLTNENLKKVLDATKKTVEETKEGKFQDLQASTAQKATELKNMFNEDFRNKLHTITQQAVRQNHDVIKKRLPGIGDKIPTGLLSKLPLPQTFSLATVLQTISNVVDRVGTQPYGEIDPTLLPTSLEDIKAMNGEIVPVSMALAPYQQQLQQYQQQQQQQQQYNQQNNLESQQQQIHLQYQQQQQVNQIQAPYFHPQQSGMYPPPLSLSTDNNLQQQQQQQHLQQFYMWQQAMAMRNIPNISAPNGLSIQSQQPQQYQQHLTNSNYIAPSTMIQLQQPQLQPEHLQMQLQQQQQPLSLPPPFFQPPSSY